MWTGILIALGLGGLAYGIFKAAQVFRATAAESTGGADALFRRVSDEGILKSLFPKGGIFSSIGAGGSGSSSAAGGYEDPAAYGRAVRDLASAGLDIAKYVQAQNKGSLAPVPSKAGSSGSRPAEPSEEWLDVLSGETAID